MDLLVVVDNLINREIGYDLRYLSLKFVRQSFDSPFGLLSSSVTVDFLERRGIVLLSTNVMVHDRNSPMSEWR